MEPYLQQQFEQMVAIDHTKTRQMVDQRRETLFALKAEIRLAAHTAALHDVGAARRPLQQRLRTEQIPHAHRAGQASRQHELASREHGFERLE